MLHSRRTLLRGVAGSASLAGAGRSSALVEPCLETRWTGDERDRLVFPGRFHDDPALVTDPLVLGTDDGLVRAIDVSDGGLLWQFDAGSGPVVPVPTDDAVFVSGRSVAALDPRSGLERWSEDVEGNSGPPVVAGDVLYAVVDGVVYAFGRDDGSVRWRSDTGVQVTGPPVVGDARVYLASGDDVLAVDGETGRTSWQRTIGGTTPLRLGGVSDDGVYAWRNGRLLALDGDGAVRWRFDTGRRSHLPLVTVGTGSIYVPGRDLLALDATDGAVEWRAPLQGEPRYPPPSVVDGTIYAGTETDVYAVDAANGDLVWRFGRGEDATPFWGQAGPESVLVPDEALHVVDATTGRERWRFDPAGRVYWAERAGEVVVAGSVDGKLHAVEPARGPLGTVECRFGTGGALALGGVTAALLAGVKRFHSSG